MTPPAERAAARTGSGVGGCAVGGGALSSPPLAAAASAVASAAASIASKAAVRRRCRPSASRARATQTAAGVGPERREDREAPRGRRSTARERRAQQRLDRRDVARLAARACDAHEHGEVRGAHRAVLRVAEGSYGRRRAAAAARRARSTGHRRSVPAPRPLSARTRAFSAVAARSALAAPAASSAAGPSRAVSAATALRCGPPRGRRQSRGRRPRPRGRGEARGAARLRISRSSSRRRWRGAGAPSEAHARPAWPTRPAAAHLYERPGAGRGNGLETSDEALEVRVPQPGRRLDARVVGRGRRHVEHRHQREQQRHHPRRRAPARSSGALA